MAWNFDWNICTAACVQLPPFPKTTDIFFFFFFFFKGRVGGRFFLQLSGHIPQVRIQFTALQINKQDQQRLLALILIQNVVFDRREITWFT